jgi:Bacterial Ig domain
MGTALAKRRQCDLVVTGMSWSADSGLTWSKGSVPQDASVLFRATIKNRGNASSPPQKIIRLAFRVDGQAVAWRDISGGLAAGQSIATEADAGPDNGFWFPSAPGGYVVRAVVDSTGQVSESNEENNGLSATIEVEATTPVALTNDDSASIPVDTPVLIDVLANDTAPAGYALVVAAVQSPTDRGGTAVITPDRKFVKYTPPAGFSGEDSFTYDNGIVPA